MSKTTCRECGHERIQCDYDKKSWGPCKKDAVGKVDDNDYCEDHFQKVCCMCGEQATHGCDSGLGGLLCGMPLCSKSECSKKHIEAGHSGMRKVAQGITRSISGHDFYVES